MIVKQMLLAFFLLLVAFVMEVTRRVITGDQPTTFFYGIFLWILLFVSAQPPFLRHSLRKPTRCFDCGFCSWHFIRLANWASIAGRNSCGA